MRVAIAILLAALALHADAAVTRIINNFATTNAPSDATNIIRSITKSNDFTGSFTGDGTGLTGLAAAGDYVPRSGTNMTGGLTNHSRFDGNAAGLTNLPATSLTGSISDARLPIQRTTNALNQMLTLTTTNCLIDLINYSNVAQLSFTLNCTTNVYVQGVSNANPGVSFNVEFQQGGQFTLNWNTNTPTTGLATFIPPSYGQFLTMPTNTTASRQFVTIMIGSSGTNAYLFQNNIVR